MRIVCRFSLAGGDPYLVPTAAEAREIVAARLRAAASTIEASTRTKIDVPLYGRNDALYGTLVFRIKED